MMSEPIRVLIVDDHDMLRKGIASFLYAVPDLELVGEASSGSEAVDLCLALKPDVILMDLVMPEMDGVTAIKTIRQQQSEVRIVALSSFAEHELIKSAIEAGALGYMLKNVPAEKLAEAIRMAHSGIAPLSPEITANLFSPAEPAPQFNITQREQDVLVLLVDGFSNAEIAYRLGISQYTVKNHVSNILGKLGVESRTDAVRVAIRNNLV